MKTGLVQVLAILVLVQCSPVHQGPGGVEGASAPGLKSDPASNPSASAKSPAPEVVPSSPTASGPVEADPRLVVRNAYMKRQYVFLGNRLLGSVEPGAEGAFEIPPGAHSIMFSDSPDGRSNHKTLAEVFDSGYAYQYDVLAH